MCGIAGIILKQKANFDLNKKIVLMTDAISHRGPDGEGFIIANDEIITPYFSSLQKKYQRTDLNYIPKTSIENATTNSFLAFGHRRLSIIDLSETGHQPMCSANEKTWITFNGEIYNYIEIKKDLLKLGHSFVSESDTEVVLAAYKEWGFDCVGKFNGMWAFCIYDSEKQICFASRDRLGVKPFYYIDNKEFLSFASEQKAFVKSGLISPIINQKALHNFLINGLLETETNNFFDGVSELFPGNNLVFDLKTKNIKINTYYNLTDHINLNNDNLSEKELIDKISEAFENAVKLRLRSDVEVGTCLSGGIDSSALAVTISEITKQPLYCFTSIFKNQSINEEHFADSVAKKINAKHFKVEPSLEGFLEEVDALIYSQDVPIWDTSTYAQYKVMELAKKNNIKVVLDGQGADELFAGYHHHFLAKWNNLFSQGHYMTGLNEILSSKKTIPNPLQFYLKEKIKQKNYLKAKEFDLFFNANFLKSQQIKNPSVYFNSVNEQLVDDIYHTRLKSFLKCEDRCGMWHSVESRTPFADDIELINLLFSFNGNKKIKNGVSKYLLREAVKNKLPEEIYKRYDKKGFETPMQQWMQKLRPQLLTEIKAANFEFINNEMLDKSDLNNSFQNKLLFKLFVLSRWKKLFS
ncbi:MAG: asparagine synthase (glutamine-hydrolyzing) [Bacteroidota bacterium]|nr:asparagine synthase (glutamine-hydrolyzing) [Bacteroidota bacterium]MDP3145647.1 asparagine synthase (glutamine-hydrolyzing) [Bacteroidota bacterium]